MRISFLPLYFVFAFLIQSAFGAVRPSFRLHDSAWRATEIVVVTTTPNDGMFEVIESWKGDLGAGEKVTLPELRPDPSALPISKYPKSLSNMFRGGVSEQIPRQPVGARMILFLVRNSGTSKTWKPSDLMDSMKASVLWIDHGHIFSFGQLFNPGPSVLGLSRLSEEEVRSRVAEIRSIQERAISVLDGAERAEQSEGIREFRYPAGAHIRHRRVGQVRARCRADHQWHA